jgi:hypothetical protein
MSGVAVWKGEVKQSAVIHYVLHLPLERLRDGIKVRRLHVGKHHKPSETAHLRPSSTPRAPKEVQKDVQDTQSVPKWHPMDQKKPLKR